MTVEAMNLVLDVYGAIGVAVFFAFSVFGLIYEGDEVGSIAAAVFGGMFWPVVILAFLYYWIADPDGIRGPK